MFLLNRSKILLPVFIGLLSVLVSMTASAQWLRISSGSYIVNNGKIVLSNSSFHNAGSLVNSNTSNFIFRGNQNSFIQGNGTSSFYGLELDKISGELSLQKNIKVSGPLKFSQGLMNLRDHNVELIYPNGLLINENEQARIFTEGTGEVYIQQEMNMPSNSNPGNLGAIVTSTKNLGLTTIRRGHQPQTDNQQQSIKRYYTIVPANNQNLNAGLRFTYFNNELNNLAENNLVIFRLDNKWLPVGKDSADANANYIQKTGLTSLQKFTLFATENSVLPLQLVAFDVACKDNATYLKWITANEVNTKEFAIEKSSNGVNWQIVDHAKAKGTALQNNYSVTLPAKNNDLFRLKMEDMDGQYTYSPVRKPACSDKIEISIGPNPTTGIFNVSFQIGHIENFVVRLFDSKGSLVMNKNLVVDHFKNEIFNVQSLTAGTYLLSITNTNGTNKTFQLIKK